MVCVVVVICCVVLWDGLQCFVLVCRSGFEIASIFLGFVRIGEFSEVPRTRDTRPHTPIPVSPEGARSTKVIAAVVVGRVVSRDLWVPCRRIGAI